MTLLERFRAGDVRALARLISLVEDGHPTAESLVAELDDGTRPATVVGMTGPPGAGKSSLIAALLVHWRAQGERVAVLAVDPSSARSGGAALGDRLRLAGHQADTGVYIRSMAARGQLGGLAAAAERAVTLAAAFGFKRIVVETVGAGQAEVDIRRLADVVVVVQVPGLGDEVQAIKAGILEVADIIAVNKSDLPGTDRVAGQLRALVTAGDHVPLVLTVSATTGKGVPELAAAIDKERRAPPDRPGWARRHLVETALADVRRRLDGLPLLETLAAEVSQGRTSPAAARRRLLRELGLVSRKDR